MRYPNLRYGSSAALEYYAMGRDLKELARHLRRDERTVKDWLSGRQRVPWWVPEILRLERVESAQYLRHLSYVNGEKHRPAMGIVTHEGQLELRRPTKKKPQITDLRLDDFDEPACG